MAAIGTVWQGWSTTAWGDNWGQGGGWVETIPWTSDETLPYLQFESSSVAPWVDFTSEAESTYRMFTSNVTAPYRT